MLLFKNPDGLLNIMNIYGDFSDAQGRLTLQSVVGSG